MSKSHADIQLAELSVFVHGVLAAFHALGILYNVKRRNTLDTVVHSAACAYDVHSVVKHLRDVRDLSGAHARN